MYRWKWEIGSFFLGVLLYVSWLASPLRNYWNMADETVFYALNGSLEWGGVAYQYAVAIANHRLFDLIPASLMAIIFAHFMLQDKAAHFNHRLSTSLFIAVYVIFAMQCSDLIMISERHSPTLLLDPVWHLNELIPQINAKESSTSSFPGDHAAVLILVSCFAWLLMGRRVGILAFVFAIIFSMPRLIGGAHWFSDVMVGSVSVALIFMPLALATPLMSIGVRLLEKPISKLPLQNIVRKLVR